MPDHSHGGRQESCNGEQNESPFEGEKNMGGVEPPKDGQQSDDFRPRFTRWFVQ